MPAPLRDLDDRHRTRAPAPLLECTVREVDTDRATVIVTADRQSRTQPRGPCPYQRGAEPPPEPGDKAWLAVADTGRLVVLVWWAP